MIPGDTFTHNNGTIHTVLDVRGPDTLVSYDTERGRYYAVVWKLEQLENGRYVWNQGHYYQQDFTKAQRALFKRSRDRTAPKIVPFNLSR